MDTMRFDSGPSRGTGYGSAASPFPIPDAPLYESVYSPELEDHLLFDGQPGYPFAMTTLSSRLFTRVFAALALLCALVIIQQSLVIGGTQTATHHFDKLMHFTAYGVLALFARLGFPKIAVIVLSAGLLIMGLGIEVIQHFFIEGRTGSFADGLANGLGIALGMGLATFAVRGRTQSTSVPKGHRR